MRPDATVWIVVAIAVIACGRPPQAGVQRAPAAKGETIVLVGRSVVEEDAEWTQVCMLGRASMDTNPATGKLEPSHWKEGSLWLFHATEESAAGFAEKACALKFDTRLDLQLPAGFVPTTGTVYRVTSARRLQEVDRFDPALKRTPAEVAAAYLRK